MIAMDNNEESFMLLSRLVRSGTGLMVFEDLGFNNPNMGRGIVERAQDWLVYQFKALKVSDRQQ